MDSLTKRELKSLLEKVTMYVSVKLQKIKEDETYTDVEIGKLCNLPSSRVSELRYYKQNRVNANGEVKQIYKKPIFLNQLERMLSGGLLTVTELKSNLDLNPKEEHFINNMIIFEDDLLRLAASELKRLGYDPGKVLFKIMKKIKHEGDELA